MSYGSGLSGDASISCVNGTATVGVYRSAYPSTTLTVSVPEGLINVAGSQTFTGPQVLPAEGSDEWLALLPGWTGWRYALGSDAGPFYWVRSNIGNGTSWTWQDGDGPGGQEGLDIGESNLSDSEISSIGGILYRYNVSYYTNIGWYYFRGPLVDDLGHALRYMIGRATSLIPQV